MFSWRNTLIAGILSAGGFILTASLQSASVVMLYISYGVLAGLGIGIAYNVLIATVSAWFPDKKGLYSGCLMMGFGASALVLGNVANTLFSTSLGWRYTYIILGVALGIVLIIAGLILKKPGEDTVIPQPNSSKNSKTEDFERKDYTAGEMLRRPSFWMTFVCISFLNFSLSFCSILFLVELL